MATMKETTIQLRVGEDEKAILKALAEKNGLTLSEFIRSLCKKAVLTTMNGDSLIDTKPSIAVEQDESAYIDLSNRSMTKLGGKDWVNYTYITTPEKRAEAEAVAKQYGTTMNTMVRNLLMKWLTDRRYGVTDTLNFAPRPRGVVSSERIAVSLDRSDKDEILAYLKQSGVKLTILIDALISKYAIGEGTECKA